MKYIAKPNLKIAAGWNNIAGLETIETIIATGETKPFIVPSAWFNNSPGRFRITLDQNRYISGKKSGALQFTFMTKLEWFYWSETYCGSGYTGNMTVQIEDREPGVYLTYNTINYLPPQRDTTNRLGRVGSPLRIDLVGLTEIP
ncbi:MAG: hypothetical protein ACYTBJ_14725 [Planctomycetota bacterium]|jgi:hypothetical protein